jgi:hypothetical protein
MKQNNHATPHETVVGISEESRKKSSVTEEIRLGFLTIDVLARRFPMCQFKKILPRDYSNRGSTALGR